MTTKAVLSKAIETVTFLLAAFSGFLKSVAPPEEANASYAVGIASFLALAALLFISTIAKNAPMKKYKRSWLIAASVIFLLAAISAVTYKWNLDKLTFPYPPERQKAEYVGGTEMKPDAKGFKDRTGKSDAEVVAAFGGLTNRELVWSSEAHRRAQLLLTINYVALVLTLAATVFSLTEGTLRR